jgi:deoxyribose-phosphate aldolase
MDNEMPDEVEISRVITETLTTLGASRQDFESACGTLLRSEPAWPGHAWQPTDPAELAPFIDHTLLRPDATDLDIWRLCLDARALKFASVCVNSCHVKRCATEVAGTGVSVCSVVGFPLGAMATAAKRAETEYAVDNGAGEVDMVINIGKLKSGGAADTAYVFEDIKSVVEGAWGSPVKVILETCLLTPVEIIAGSVISVMAGAAFVKTSTGFSKGGATPEHVSLMRRVVGPNIGVKASGGVRTYDATIRMIQSGANRIGTSSGAAILSREEPAAGY